MTLVSNNNINQIMNDIRSLERRIALIQVTGSDAYYRHTQGVSASVWTINHNLNKRPSVTVTDSAGTVIIGQVKYLSNNSVELSFSAAFSGFAELN